MDKILDDIIYTQYGLGGLLLLVLIPAFWKIHTELTKLRVQMAHQLNRDLLSKRSMAYGDLWSRMQPTAIYTSSSFGPSEVNTFSENLSKWYFSANGGLFLTGRARDFYFALQGLLQSVGQLKNWQCNKRPENPKSMFDNLLKDLVKKDSSLKKEIDSNLDCPEKLNPDKWEKLCKLISDDLVSRVKELDVNVGESIYVSIQQVSSILRTNLTHDIRSRLGVEWPVV